MLGLISTLKAIAASFSGKSESYCYLVERLFQCSQLPLRFAFYRNENDWDRRGSEVRFEKADEAIEGPLVAELSPWHCYGKATYRRISAVMAS